MESREFIQWCKEKFGYLKQDFGFNIIEENDELIKPYIIFGNKVMKIKVNYEVFESPSFPITIYLITEEKKLFGKFFKEEKICELDDLLIYKKCNINVYDYLKYNNIESFYNKMTEEEITFYGEKYSKDVEVLMLLDKYAYLLHDFGCDILKGDLNILVEIRKMREKNDKEHNCNSFLY
jgi:hypothetical protein